MQLRYWVAMVAGTMIAVVTVLILVVHYSVEIFAVKGKPFKVELLRNYVDFFIIGVTVLVVAVPEGLPLAVTLALAYSVRVGAPFSKLFDSSATSQGTL